MRAARQHIVRELKKKEILQREIAGEKRNRKRTKKFDKE
jgi:hypothetical protein